MHAGAERTCKNMRDLTENKRSVGQTATGAAGRRDTCGRIVCRKVPRYTPERSLP